VLPEELLATRLYVVVAEGVTTRLPELETLPMPGSMLTEVAPVTSQLMVEDAPAEMEGGLETKVFITGMPEVGPVVAEPFIVKSLLSSSDQLPLLSCTLK
jgi:hypothetical protein